MSGPNGADAGDDSYDCHFWDAGESKESERQLVLDLDVSECARESVFDLARSGRELEVRARLDARTALVDERYQLGKTALWLACWYGHTSLASMLLQRGADPRTKTFEGVSVLVAASRWERTLELLLSTVAIADVNEEGSGATPLLQATNIHVDGSVFPEFDYSLVPERIRCVDRLLLAGGDINRRNRFGRTPLMVAVLTGSARMTKRLLMRGARCDIADVDGKRAVDYSDDPELRRLVNPLKAVGDAS